MTAIITLTTAGADTGPYNLFSDVDGYYSAFATNVSQAELLAGYYTEAIPDGTFKVRIMSIGTCTNYINVDVYDLSLRMKVFNESAIGFNFSFGGDTNVEGTINWGDGTPIETFGPSTSINPFHYYYGASSGSTFNIGISFTNKNNVNFLNLLGLDGDSVLGLIDFNCKKLNNLHNLWVYGCKKLSSIDLSGSSNIQNISIDYNSTLTSLNLDGCTSLTTLQCINNYLLSLDTSTLTSLQTLICSVNPISSLTLNSSALTNLQFTSTAIEDIDISLCPNISTFYGGVTPLKTITYHPSISNLFDVNVSYAGLSSDEVNKLLAQCVISSVLYPFGTLICNNQGILAPPTGQGIIDKAYLESLGWLIATD